MSETLIVVNEYDLTAARVETEGDPGVRSYRFFVAADGRSARAVVRYDGPEAWIGHHEISFPWPEMRALHATATLSRATFLGPFTDAMRDWLARSPLRAEIAHYGREAAGFDRHEPE